MRSEGQQRFLPGKAINAEALRLNGRGLADLHIVFPNLHKGLVPPPCF